MMKPFFKPGAIVFTLILVLIFSVFSLALARQFKAATAGYDYRFPRDHAAHPDYRTEWWYYTGHLKTAEGKRYGYELTFFRVGLDQKENAPQSSSPWATENVYAAHFAVSDENNRQFNHFEKLNRSGLDVAGARSDVYYVWNELWFAQQLGTHHVLRASSPSHALHLLLSAEKPPVIHGRNGISQKASCAGCASHYYSMTRLKTEGFLMRDGKAVPVTGLSWMDHEFGSNQLGRDQTGWDWFSLQLSDDTDLMLYLLRRDDGTIDPNSSGTVVSPDGRSRHLELSEFTVKNSGRTWTSPKTGGRYPMGWTVNIPSEKLSLNVEPAFENQELTTAGSTGVAYWEGASTVSGSHRGQAVNGEAYVEMTGYAAPFKQRI